MHAISFFFSPAHVISSSPQKSVIILHFLAPTSSHHPTHQHHIKQPSPATGEGCWPLPRPQPGVLDPCPGPVAITGLCPSPQPFFLSPFHHWWTKVDVALVSDCGAHILSGFIPPLRWDFFIRAHPDFMLPQTLDRIKVILCRIICGPPNTA